MKINKQEKRLRRHARVRSKISGTPTMPRVSVFRSNKNMLVQVIDDTTVNGTKTILGMSDVKMKGTKTETAKALGIEVGKKLLESGIKKALFDRGGFKYHGRVEAVAAGAREAGLLL